MNVSWVEIQSDFYVSLMLPLSCIYGWRREEECFITFLTVRSALMVSLFPIKQTPLLLRCTKIIQKYLTWNLFIIDSSVQAEKIKIAYPTFLDAWDLRSHTAGHFFLQDVVNAYHPGPLAPTHKKQDKTTITQ